MALIKNYMPPSRENYEWLVYLFGTYFAVVISSEASSENTNNG
jgi:hypothetical protein